MLQEQGQADAHQVEVWQCQAQRLGSGGLRWVRAAAEGCNLASVGSSQEPGASASSGLSPATCTGDAGVLVTQVPDSFKLRFCFQFNE